MGFFGSLAKIGAFGLVGRKAYEISNANKQLDSLAKQDPTYTQNPYAGNRLGLAQSMFGSRLPGAATLERGAYTSQANNLDFVNKTATDASQALQLGAMSQATTNDTLNNLAAEEVDWTKYTTGNLNNAYEGMINEGDKVYQDLIRRFQDKSQIMGAKTANESAMSDYITQLATSLASMGLSGGFGGGGFGKSRTNSFNPNMIGNYPLYGSHQ